MSPSKLDNTVTAPLESAFDASLFLESNVLEMNLPPLTRDRLREQDSVGTVVTSPDGVEVLAHGGRFLGKPLSPEELQKALVGSSQSTLFVLFGLGVGHTARALRALTRAPIIVYEPHIGLLRTVLEQGPQDLADLDIVTNGHDLAIVWGRFAGTQRDVTIINTPGYSAAFPAECAELPAMVTRLVERVSITKNTYRKRARSWVEDILSNVELLARCSPFLALENHYKGVPAFIVGAGPSLDKNVQLLREAGKKGIVIAANSGALALGNHGISPQVIACIESIDISERLQTIPYIDHCVRAFSLAAHPNSLRTGKGPLLPIYEAIPQYSLPMEELTGVPGVSVCGSVSTAAFSLAQKLGCSPIVLVGQDMAFTQGRTYAGGTGYESSTAQVDSESGQVRLAWNEQLKKLHGTQHGQRHTSEPLMHATAWGGDGTVASGPSFMALNTWFEGMAALLQQSKTGTRLVNATEGGARVVGFEEITLRELLDGLPEIQISFNEIAEAAATVAKPRTFQDIARWALDQAALTRATRRKARRVRRLAEHATRAVDSENPKSISRAFSTLDRAELELKRAVSAVPLVDAWSHLAVDSLMQEQGASNELDARANARRAVLLGGRVSEAIEDSARELENILNTLAQKLHQTTS